MRVKSIIFRICRKSVRLLFRFFPKWEEICYPYCFQGEKKAENSLFATVIREYFWEKYYKLPIAERLKVQETLMGGNASVDWAKQYEVEDAIPFPPERGTSFVGTIDFHDICIFFDYLDKKLSAASSKCTVIQLGASSGKEIFYFARKFSQHDFIYTDIFPSIVEYKKKNCDLKNVSFETASADMLHTIISRLETKHNIILSSGSAQYVYPEHLDYMFSKLANSVKQGSTLEVVLNEPGSCLNQDPLQIKGSTPRGNCSYTHNYLFYAEKYGFSAVAWKKIMPYTDRAQFPANFGTCHLVGALLFHRPK